MVGWVPGLYLVLTLLFVFLVCVVVFDSLLRVYGVMLIVLVSGLVAPV